MSLSVSPTIKSQLCHSQVSSGKSLNLSLYSFTGRLQMPLASIYPGRGLLGLNKIKQACASTAQVHNEHSMIIAAAKFLTWPDK